MLLLAAISFVVATRAVALATATSPEPLTHGGTPPGIPLETDCAIREFAWEYGRKLQPTRGAFKDLYDALQLGACGVPLPLGMGMGSWSPAQQQSTPVDALEVIVDPKNGDDAAAELSLGRTAFATIAKAIDAASSTRAPGQRMHVVLRGGTHFVPETIQLTSAHSHLTIRNFDGEEAVISGGVNLTAPWRPSKRCAGCFEADLSKQGLKQVLGLRRNGIREIRARYPNFDPELDSTINGTRHFHNGQDGWITEKTKWIPSTTGTMNNVSPWPPTDVAKTFVIRDTDWPGVEWPMNIMTNGTVDPDSWTGEGEWGEYWLGAGGTCVDRDPPVGYWCAPQAPRHISTPNHPSGINTGLSLPNAGRAGYKNATGAVIHAWRPGHWYTNTFEVGTWTAPDPSTSNVTTSWQIFPNMNNVASRAPASPGIPASPGCGKDCTVQFIGVFNTTNECWAAVNASTAGPFRSFTWHSLEFPLPYRGHCYADTSFTWLDRKQENIVSAKAPGWAPDGGSGSTLMFSRGGTQGGEGVTGGEAWYIENVLEELDTEREWFFDDTDQILIYKPNGTATPTGEFVVTSLKVLFNISGTKQAPAHHIAITGVTLRDTVYTYFDPHGLPSGGDWGLQQQGAITLVGTESVTVEQCLLTRLDGNAIFIGGYNRNLTISNNEFSFIGDGAMASWGDTSSALNANGSLTVPGGYKVGPDGRGGEQPRGSIIENNICHEIGLWQKQSSLWFQAVTAQTILRNNIFFNGPRAAFNFNVSISTDSHTQVIGLTCRDGRFRTRIALETVLVSPLMLEQDGFGGGDDISGNLLLNCVRESSDHGPWNSWSRVPYITNIRTGKPSIIPAVRKIRRNFILATYFSQQAIDTDDGSAYYEVTENFFAYGDNGLKSDFGGHDNYWHKNVLAYVGNCYTTFSFKGYNDEFYDNQCIFRGSYNSDCGVSTGFVVHNNTVYSKSGELQVCKMDFNKWTAAGHDKGSTLAKWPTDAEIVAMGKKVLDM